MFQLYQEQTSTVLIQFMQQTYSAFYLDPICAQWQFIGSSDDQSYLLSQCKIYFSINFSFQPKSTFDSIIGFVPSAKQSYIITCNKLQSVKLLGQNIYKPINIQFIPCKMMLITEYMGNQLIVNEKLIHLNLLFGFDQLYIKQEQALQLQIQEEQQEQEIIAGDLIQQLQQFFQEHSTNMYFSDSLDLTNVLSEQQHYKHLERTQYYLNNLLFKKMNQFQSAELFKTQILSKQNLFCEISQQINAKFNCYSIQITKLLLGSVSQVEFYIDKQRFLQTIITRQNVLHVGTRYNARGLNSVAGAANEFEHEIIYETAYENHLQRSYMDDIEDINQSNENAGKISGFCCGYTILRGTVPIHWYSSAGLLKHEFLLKDQPFLLANFYWQQIFDDYKSCTIINLLRPPKTPKTSITQDTQQEPSDRENDDGAITIIPLDQSTIQSTSAPLTTSEEIICGAYKEYVQSSQYKDRFEYYNYDWHKQLKEIKQKVKIWFKNGGQITQNGPNLFTDGITNFIDITINQENKNGLVELRKQQIYIIQMINLIQILQQVNLNKFDMTFGTFQTQINHSLSINVFNKQNNILRINCADSLDRTNIAIFHLQSFINSITINFFTEKISQINEIIQLSSNNCENQMLNSQTLAISSVSRQKQYNSGFSINIQQLFNEYLNKYIKKFSEVNLLDPYNSLLAKLSVLENLLFRGVQGMLYSKLSLIFFDIANLISMIYTGVCAAHQEIMQLFCDIEVQSNSMIAFKRRIISMQNQEKVRNETMKVISVQNLLNYYKIMPFSPTFNGKILGQNNFGQQKGQNYASKSYENNYTTFSITPSQQDFIQFSYLNYIYNLENNNYKQKDLYTASQLSYQLLKELISKYNVQQIKYYMLCLNQKSKIFKSQNLAGYIYELYQNHQKILLKNEDLYHFYKAKSEMFFNTKHEFEQLQPFSILFKQNLIQFTQFMSNPKTDQERIKESLKVQLSTDFCSLDLAKNTGLTYSLPIYLIQNKLQIYREEIQKEIVDKLVSHELKQYNCIPIQYEFRTLTSLTHIVLLMPPINVGNCCEKFLIIGTDENDIEFLLQIATLPQQILGEQQLCFPCQDFQLQSNNYNYLLLNSLSQMLTGQNIISSISGYPRLKKLEIIFIYKESIQNVLPKMFLIGNQQETFKKQRCNQDQTFIMKQDNDLNEDKQIGWLNQDKCDKLHDTLFGLHDQLIKAKISDLENIVRPYDIKLPDQKTYLLLLFDTQTHIYSKDQRKESLGNIYSYLFNGNINELKIIEQTLGYQIITEQFLIHVYIMSLGVPMYYVYGMLQLLSTDPVNIQAIVSGQLNLSQINIQNYRIYEYPFDYSITVNNQTVKLDYLIQNNYNIEYFTLGPSQNEANDESSRLYKIHDIIDQITISKLYGQTAKTVCVPCKKCLKNSAITQCFVCKNLCCINCLFGSLHVNIIGFDLTKQVITCNQCGIMMTQVQNMISAYIYQNMFNGSNVSLQNNSINQYLSINKDTLVIKQNVIEQNTLLYLTNRVNIDETPEIKKIAHDKYKTLYLCKQQQNNIVIEYKLTNQRPLNNSEIQLIIPQKTQLTSSYVNLTAIGTYFQQENDVKKQNIQSDASQKIQIHDQKAEKNAADNYVSFYYILPQLQSIGQIKIINTTPLPYYIVVTLHTQHEDDAYVKTKKRPSRHIKAKQNEACKNIEQIILNVAPIALGDKYITYNIIAKEKVNRLTIKLYYNCNLDKKDSFQFPELWT